jgi:hypothetical protein
MGPCSRTRRAHEAVPALLLPAGERMRRGIGSGFGVGSGVGGRSGVRIGSGVGSGGGVNLRARDKGLRRRLGLLHRLHGGGHNDGHNGGDRDGHPDCRDYGGGLDGGGCDDVAAATD